MNRERNTNTIDTIVIHCSATPNGRWTTAPEIDGWHAARGFRRSPALARYQAPALPHIGYHLVIYTNGAALAGRGLNEAGAHAMGHNLRSIGVCLIGTDRYSLAQWRTLKAYVESTRKQLPAIRRVVGHRDLSPDQNGDGLVEPWEWLKTCPGFDVAAWLVGGMEPLTGHVLEVRHDR